MAPEEWLSHDNNPYPGLVGNKKYRYFLPKFLSIYLSANFFSLEFWSCVTFYWENKTKKSKKVLTLYFANIFPVSKVGENVWLYWSDWEKTAWETSSYLPRLVYREDPYQHWHFMECLGWLNHFWETNVFVALKYKKKHMLI